MQIAKQKNTTNCFELKASLFTLPILQLLSANIEGLPEQLSHKATLAPNFFQSTPIVIDLHLLPHQATIDFDWLNRTLRSHSMIPVGVRSGTIEQQLAAKTAGFAVLLENKDDMPIQKTSTLPSDGQEIETHSANKLITKPVRSGQQVYAEKGDLVIIASVSEGAEVLAHGNIHVYGTLRGRALAGVNGDSNARIFCHDLESELVAIAGHYKTLEDKSAIPQQGPLQIYLKNDQLLVEAFKL